MVNSQAAAKSEKNASIPCRSLETFKEDVVGFLVKKPAGWIIRYTTGIITILRDSQGQEGVLIYPIRPQTGFTLENFFSSFMNILKESSKDSSRVDYADVTQGRGQVQAKVSGFIGGKTVIGEAAAFPSGPDYILTLYWAPTEELSSRQLVLKCIADSYQKAPGQPLVKLSEPILKRWPRRAGRLSRKVRMESISGIPRGMPGLSSAMAISAPIPNR